MSLPVMNFLHLWLFVSVTFGFHLTASSSSSDLLRANVTIQSENGTFALGFFNTNDEFKWYLGIWYASIPTPIYVWVANREIPVKNRESATVELTVDGRLAVRDSGNGVVWQTSNTEKAVDIKLLDQGTVLRKFTIFEFECIYVILLLYFSSV